MKRMTNASSTLNAYIDLLRKSAGLNICGVVQDAGLGTSQDRPALVVEFTGPDACLLTGNNGELLHAIEHIAAKLLRLEPEEHDRISFDAENFKANRERALHRLANDAVCKVRTTCAPYAFPPMMSRERRLLHLALASSGLKSASTGESFRRSVVLYPEGVHPPSKPPGAPGLTSEM